MSPQDASSFSAINSSSAAGYSSTNQVANSMVSQSFTQALAGLPVVSASAAPPHAPYYSSSASMPMTMMMMGTNMLNTSTSVSSSNTGYGSGGVIAAHPMLSVGPMPMTAAHEAPAMTQHHQHSRYQQQQRQPQPPIQTELHTSQQQQSVPELEKQWAALKALKWVRGKELTAYVQDLALQSGKRALVATSGGSYKKFVCSSETPCPWLINAVCSRPRKRSRRRDNGNGSGAAGVRGEEAGVSGGNGDEENNGRYWYITSGNLSHANCSSSAKPTARQLKNSYLMQAAVQDDSRVSSAVLVERLKQQEQLVCSKSMVYKAKTDLLDELAKSQHQARSESANSSTSNSGLQGPGSATQLLESVQSLPSYLTQMSALNPHVMSFVERDDDGAFLRAVLAMDPTGVWNDQSVLGVDSCEMQHRNYNGTELVLVGRDGNLNPIVHAIALVPEESPEHCTWFLEKLIAHGFPLRRFPLFTNGHWGFTASCATQQIPHVMYCTQHLIDDMKQNPAITLRSGDQEALAWKAQQAESESEYFGTLGQLGQLNFAAAHYVKSLDPKRWALFPYLAMRKMYGWQTTFVAAVDHGESMGLAPRSQLPFEFFKAISLVLMTGTFQRHERAVQWEREQRVVTPEAERLMQDEMKLLPMYNVAMSTPHLAFVWNANEPQIRQRRVDLQHRTCTCAFRMQWGIPCRHILAALQKLANGFNQTFEFFDECYLVRNYVSSFKGRYLELPLDETIQRDATLLPARLVNKTNSSSTSNSTSLEDGSQGSEQQHLAGPKKRRVRNRPLEDRKRGIYKCHKCHRAEGHNKGTCPYQLHQPPVVQQQPPLGP
ncbi:hypothetical protein Gpo141_00005484 [Globisporangium polare]